MRKWSVKRFKHFSTPQTNRDSNFKTSNHPPSSYKLFGHNLNPLFELALIRFVHSNVRITAYFINLMLIAAFNEFLIVGNASSTFFGNVNFSYFFNSTGPITSLGYDLIGAIFGGLLEYSSMALGTKNICLLALVLYILVFLIHGSENN